MAWRTVKPYAPQFGARVVLFCQCLHWSFCPRHLPEFFIFIQHLETSSKYDMCQGVQLKSKQHKKAQGVHDVQVASSRGSKVSLGYNKVDQGHHCEESFQFEPVQMLTVSVSSI